MRPQSITSFGLAVAVAAAACGPGAREEDDTTGDDSPSIDAPPPLPPDAGCGGDIQPIELTKLLEPDLVIVLDRSGSMSGTLGAGTRWTVMRDAVNTIASTYEDNIKLGLVEFPYDENCGVGPLAVRVPVDLGQAPEIMTYFQTRVPGGATPSELGLVEALNLYNSIPVNPAGRYVLFATDGEPTCAAEAETVTAVTNLANAGIKTYVLGFAGGFSDPLLNSAALAGLVPRPNGPPHYYSATNATELDMVLEDIAGGIAVGSCSFMLAMAPPDPDNVSVTINGVFVPRSPSHTNGWDYHPDASTITLFGVYCDQIMNGGVTEVSFGFGCPGPIEK
jgi:hypothetical protein